MRRQSGFTLTELMITIAIVVVLLGIATPNFLRYLPRYRLKSAVDELFTNLNLAKMAAVRQGQDCAANFTAQGYTIPLLGRSVTLGDYGSGVTFVRPPADPGTAFPAAITFNTRGMSTTSSYAYLTNEARTAYFRVGALTSGVVRIQTWSGGTWQ